MYQGKHEVVSYVEFYGVFSTERKAKRTQTNLDSLIDLLGYFPNESPSSDVFLNCKKQ